MPSGPAAGGATGRWYFVITILTGGLLAAVPFFHAASHLERPRLRQIGAAMTAGSLLGFALFSASPTNAAGDPTGWLSDVAAFILLGVVLAASLLLIGPRREVYQPSFIPPTVLNANQGAQANVERGRRARNEARELAIKDPMMARELGIGRPESRAGYDDGGLLELNFATAESLSQVCGLPRTQAEAVVASRDTLGRFLSVDDVIVFGQISEDHAPMVRDRGIIIADG